MTSASAPGKIILFGEHAVVYGRPALAAPVNQVRATATINPLPAGGVQVEAPDVDLFSPLVNLPAEHPIAAAITGALKAMEVDDCPSFTLRIDSSIPVASGLGSGAAVSVAVIRALSAFLNRPLSDERVSSLAFEIEKLHHGTPSGIDNYVVTYARPVFFIRDKPIEVLKVGNPFSIVIGDTGIFSPTKETVSAVRKAWQAETSRYERLFDGIGSIASHARQAIEKGDNALVGALMNRNHALLKEMGVSSPALDNLVDAARACGAPGAKLSGGGGGGNMIALAAGDQCQELAQAILAAGARRTIITRVG